MTVRSGAPNEAHAGFFVAGGVVESDLSGHGVRFRLRWVDIGSGDRTGDADLQGGGVVTVAAPGKGNWLAVVARRR